MRWLGRLRCLQGFLDPLSHFNSSQGEDDELWGVPEEGGAVHGGAPVTWIIQELATKGSLLVSGSESRS